MKKILFVAHMVRDHIMQFNTPYLKFFKDLGWETAVASGNDYENKDECKIPYCDYYYDISFERNPFSPGNIEAYKELKKVIEEGDYDIIHCHTPVGAALAKLATKDAKKKDTKVIYTSQGFHFYDGAPLINWLVFYPVERILSQFADVIVTVNQEDYQRAQDFNADQIVYIPGPGIDLNKFNQDRSNRDEKREELGLATGDFVFLTVAELTPKKNYKLVLEALAIVKNVVGLENVQYLICGKGESRQELENLTMELKLEDHVKFLGYRDDIADICRASDAFILMSHQEGPPVALMEAMASGLPVICSDNRANTDWVRNKVTGIIPENDPEVLAWTIKRLMDNDQLQEFLVKNSMEKVQKFSLENVMGQMLEVYNVEEKQTTEEFPKKTA